jgi:hypothetical protein
MTVDPDHPAIQSIRRDGFLSEAWDFMLPSLREMHAALFDFAERTNRVGQRIMNSADVVCVGRTTHDPVAVASRLLIRSLSAFQGALILVERGMAVEPLTLIRGAYENALWLGFLRASPAEAVEALLLEERRSQRGRDKAILAQFKAFAGLDNAVRARLEARVLAADFALKGKPKVSLAHVARRGDFNDFYPYFKQLSSGAAHASLHSLSKHLDMNPDGTWSGHVTGPDSEGMREALLLGCHALLVNLAAFNGVWAEGDGAVEVTELLEEHLVLAGVPSASRDDHA